MRIKFFHFLFFVFGLMIFCLGKTALAESPKIVINEFLPNPTGSDESGEWIELANLSADSVDLFGWKIKDSSGKSFALSGKISGSGFFVLKRSETKISINNDSEKIFLIDPAGRIFSISFSGKASEGKSFARFGDNDWQWTKILTPGKINEKDSVVGDYRSDKQAKSNFVGSQNQNRDFSLKNFVFSETKALAGALILGLIFSLASIFVVRKFLNDSE